MSKGKILVTDSLFIFDEHVKQLEDADYEVERLDKPKASEAELAEAIVGKAGYILGGIEEVTEDIVNAADSLRAIVFTGTGWKGYIPAWRLATERGIAIANVPDATTYPVSEYLVTMLMAMNRRLFELGPDGTRDFKTVNSLIDLKVGFIGFGRIGQESARMLSGIGVGEITYWSPRKKSLDIKFEEMNKLLATSDIVCIVVSDDAGHDFINSEQLSLLKQDSLIVSISHKGIINEQALLRELKNQRLRAAVDFNPDDDLKKLPIQSLYYPRGGTSAYNTWKTLREASASATNSLLSLLETGLDDNLVNPEYKVS